MLPQKIILALSLSRPCMHARKSAKKTQVLTPACLLGMQPMFGRLVPVLSWSLPDERSLPWGVDLFSLVPGLLLDRNFSCHCIWGLHIGNLNAQLSSHQEMQHDLINANPTVYERKTDRASKVCCLSNMSPGTVSPACVSCPELVRQATVVRHSQIYKFSDDLSNFTENGFQHTTGPLLYCRCSAAQGMKASGIL